jgi:hypothetical protein
VRHAKVGEGVVINGERRGLDARVQVRFAGEGTKWLALQGESDKLLGRKSQFPDPLATKPPAGSDPTMGSGGFTTGSDTPPPGNPGAGQ